MPSHVSRRPGKLVFASLAAVFATLGLALIALRSSFGIAVEDAAIIAIALLVTAFADLLILWRWERLGGPTAG